MSRTILNATIIFGLLIAFAQAAPQSSSLALQKGIYAEDTLGDLGRALTIYRQVAADKQASRADRAAANCRLGACYLKKGQSAKAKQVLNGLIASYPDQEQSVARAGGMLARLAAASKGAIVLSTVPAAFDSSVSPALTRMTVTFDRKMWDKSWSWTGGGDTFPKTTGGPSYDASVRTCRLPVKLEPGKVYWVGINSPSHKNFKTPARQPARRYVILFATAGKDGKPTSIPDELLNRARSINQQGLAVARKAGAADKLAAEKLSARGWQLWQARKLTEAATAFEQAVAKDPGNANAWNGLGWAQQNQGMLLNAQESFQKCLAIDATNMGALNGLGWIARAQGKKEDAIKHWERAIQASPTATAALNGLITTYAELGQHNQVVKYARMWLKIEPQNADARSALAKAEAAGGKQVDVPDRHSTAKPLKLGPTPWTDGEKMHLMIKSMAGMDVGSLTWSVSRTSRNGKRVWRIEQYLVVPLGGTLQYSQVDADYESLAPAFGWTKNQLGDFKAVYGKDQATLTIHAGGSETSRKIAIEGVAYDNEQAFYVIRRMPLAEGYQGSFPIFPVTGGTLVLCNIEVTGRESVKVVAGTYDCYSMNLTVSTGGITVLSHKLWMSADKKKVLVKYDSGSAVMELKALEQRTAGSVVPSARRRFSEKEPNISLTMPANWQYSRNASPGQYKLYVQLLPPELRAWSAFLAQERGSHNLSVRQVADGDVKVLKGYFKGYTVDSKSWKSGSISGMPTITYHAAYDDKGKEKVEYRTYILGASHVYWFVYRVDADEFASSKKEFDAITGSLRGK